MVLDFDKTYKNHHIIFPSKLYMRDNDGDRRFFGVFFTSISGPDRLCHAWLRCVLRISTIQLYRISWIIFPRFCLTIRLWPKLKQLNVLKSHKMQIISFIDKQSSFFRINQLQAQIYKRRKNTHSAEKQKIILLWVMCELKKVHTGTVTLFIARQHRKNR